MAFSERYVTAIGGGGNGLTEPTAFTWAQAKTDMAGSSGQGKRYNIKADGTYALSGFQDVAQSGGGNATTPVYLRGYKTVIGDGYLGRVNSNGALILTNMPVFDITNGGLYTGNRTALESLSLQGSNGDTILNLGNYSMMVACRVDNNAGSGQTNAASAKMGESCVAYESDITMPATSLSTAAIFQAQNGGTCTIDSCRVICACAGSGVTVERHTVVYGCLIKGSGVGVGVNFGADTGRNPFIRNNTIVGWTDGVRIPQATDWASLTAGNMITDCSGYAVNLQAGSGCVLIGPNRTRDNALGDFNGTLSNWQLAGRILPLVTAGAGGGPTSDYANPATGDYNLIAASPGRNVNTPYFSDLGAYDHIDPSGGGGGSAVFHPLRNFIIRPA